MRNKIVDIAISQLGYAEGRNNNTKYGAWYGLNYQPWCAMFVSWCANQAVISQAIIPKFASCTAGFRAFGDKATRNKILPQKGDIIFFKWQNDGTPDHVGIVEYVEGNIIHTIEGNRSDKVGRFSYNVNSGEIYGYAFPNYSTCANNAQVQYPLIKKGSRNEYVRIAQTKLTEKGHKLYKYGIDGDFGEETRKAVIEFQKKVFPNEPKEWDGIIGTKTWAKLMQ